MPLLTFVEWHENVPVVWNQVYAVRLCASLVFKVGLEVSLDLVVVEEELILTGVDYF